MSSALNMAPPDLAVWEITKIVSQFSDSFVARRLNIPLMYINKAVFFRLAVVSPDIQPSALDYYMLLL